MQTWKEVLREGRTFYIDAETGRPASIDFTADGIRHLHDQGNAMRAANLSIPIPLEHQKDARPLTAEERAARTVTHNAGFVEKYAIRDKKLFALCDIPDPKLAAELPRTIKYTSPWITSFVDGHGKQWDGVIGHLALTTRPRIIDQAPFGSPEAALSLAAVRETFDPKKVGPKGLNVSKAGVLDAQGKPLFAAAFSAFAGIKLAGYDDKPPEKKPSGGKPPEMKGDKPPEKKEGEPPSGEKKEGVEPPGEMTPGDPNETGMIDEEMDLVDVACDLMSILGVDMPEDTDESNLLQKMLRALMDNFKMEKGADMPDPTKPTNQPPTPPANNLPPNPAVQPPKPPVVQEAPPLYMSLEDIQKLTNPQEKRLAEALLSMQGQMAADRKRTESLTKRALDDAAVARQRRIDRLSRSMTAQSRDALLGQSAGAKLSLNDDGTVTDPLAPMLDILDANLKSVPDLLLGGAVTEQGHPRQQGDKPSEERTRQIIEEWCGNTNLPNPYAEAK